MNRIVKKSFANTAGLSVRDAKIRRDVLRAFLYQACVPLIFQIPQLLTQILQMLAILFDLNLNVDPWVTVDALFALINEITVPLTPIVDVVIVFKVMKPYRNALQSALSIVFPCVKAFQPVRSGSIIQSSRPNIMVSPSV
jgi:hypothetical protein